MAMIDDWWLVRHVHKIVIWQTFLCDDLYEEDEKSQQYKKEIKNPKRLLIFFSIYELFVFDTRYAFATHTNDFTKDTLTKIVELKL